MPRYIHPHSLVLWEWLYRGMIYPPPLSSSRSEGVIPWHCIFIPHNIWWGGDYIVTYFHSPQYLVRGWLYRDLIFSLLTIFGEGVIISWHFHSSQYLMRGWLYRDIFTADNIWWGGWLYCDLIFSLLTIFGEGVIISWPYIFTPYNIWWGGDYIVTFSLLTIFGVGWLYRDIIFSLLTIFGEGVITSWPYICTPDNVWWGGDYIVTFSLLTIFGEGVIISWHIFTPDAPLESGTGGDNILIFSLSKFDYAVIPGFYYSYTYIHPMKLGGSSDYM